MFDVCYSILSLDASLQGGVFPAGAACTEAWQPLDVLGARAFTAHLQVGAVIPLASLVCATAYQSRYQYDTAGPILQRLVFQRPPLLISRSGRCNLVPVPVHCVLCTGCLKALCPIHMLTTVGWKQQQCPSICLLQCRWVWLMCKPAAFPASARAGADC